MKITEINLIMKIVLSFQVCLFQIGDYSYDSEKIQYSSSTRDYKKKGRTVILDYDVAIEPLKTKDRNLRWPGNGAKFSLTGFEVHLKRHVFKYIVDYYLTSALFVVVSWVCIKSFTMVTSQFYIVYNLITIYFLVVNILYT